MSGQPPYDPYIPAGGNAAAGRPVNNQERLDAEIKDTVNTMNGNLRMMAERGERLDSLQDKTDNLATSAQGFRRGANRVRKQMWWKDMKMRMWLIVGIIVLLLIIIVPIATTVGKK